MSGRAVISPGMHAFYWRLWPSGAALLRRGRFSRLSCFLALSRFRWRNARRRSASLPATWFANVAFPPLGFPPFSPVAAWRSVSAVGPGVSGGRELCPQEGDSLLRAGGPPLHCCPGAPQAFLLPPGSRLCFSGPSLRVLPGL